MGIIKSIKAGSVGSVTLKKDGDKYIVTFLSLWADEFRETAFENKQSSRQFYFSEEAYLLSLSDSYIKRFMKKEEK